MDISLVITNFSASYRLLITHDIWVSSERQMTIIVNDRVQLSRRNYASFEDRTSGHLITKQGNVSGQERLQFVVPSNLRDEIYKAYDDD
jgi:hypothetical protein